MAASSAYNEVREMAPFPVNLWSKPIQEIFQKFVQADRWQAQIEVGIKDPLA
jgi:hypothetical protein